MNFQESLKNAAFSIQQAEKKKAIVVEGLKKLKAKELPESKEFFEKTFVKKILPTELNCRIAGVDSGFVGQELFSTDLLLIRAVSAIFDYKNGKLEKAQYLPQGFSFPEPFFSTNALERDEFNANTSIQRLIKEVQTAIDVIEKFSPQYCFMDGSLLPQHADKPRANSKIKKNFDIMISKVQELYAVASEKNCELVGCVEDSRGNRWTGILDKELEVEGMEEYHDAVLLNDLLERQERSFIFSYTKNALEHPILNDFKKEWQNAIFAFYLKPTQYDFPLRVEFLNPNNGNPAEKAEKIAGLVLAQSSMHKEYAFPAVLIEADLRAGLKPEEINLVKDKIIDKIGKNAFILRRRDRRPFAK